MTTIRSLTTVLFLESVEEREGWVLLKILRRDTNGVGEDEVIVTSGPESGNAAVVYLCQFLGAAPPR